MIVLVCGGRTYRNWERVCGVLDAFHSKHVITLLMTGACMDRDGNPQGADWLAERWAKLNELPYLGHPARWKTSGLGRAAGTVRNGEMLHTFFCPEYGIAFPGGAGTFDMAKRLRAANVPVIEIDFKHAPHA